MMSGKPDECRCEHAPLLSRSGLAFPFDFSGLAIINVLALYGYLFWDSFESAVPALVGDRVDPLFLRGDRFMDWVNTLRSAALATPYGLEHQVAMPVYGPFTYALLAPFARSLDGMGHPQVMARLVWVGITGVVVICSVINLHRARVLLDAGAAHVAGSLLLPVLCAYPFLFAFDRGNLELITLCLVCWYVTRTIRSQLAGSQAHTRGQLVSNLILVLAVSIKPYTLLFVALLLNGPDRTKIVQLRRCVVSLIQVVLMALVLAVASLLVLYRGNLIKGVSEMMFWQNQFKLAYVIGGSGDRFFCSPYVFGKKLLASYGVPDMIMTGFYHLYPWLALAVLACMLLVTWQFVCRNPHPSVILAVASFCLLLFPLNANEYKAVYFLIPFSLGFAAVAEDGRRACASTNHRSGVFGLTPITATAGLSFIMLVNRYGLLGNNEVASMLTSLLLSVFPVLFLGSFKRIPSAGPLT